MITSFPTRAPSRSRRAGTPNAATPSPVAPTPWSPTTWAGRGLRHRRPVRAGRHPARRLAQLRQVLGAEAKILLGFDAAAPTRSPSAPYATPAPAGSPGGVARSPPSPPRRAATGPPAATASPPRFSPSPMRPWRSRTTARPGRSPCSRTAPRCCRCSQRLAAPAAALLSWLRCRWRIENLFKYLEDHYGIHWLCDYHAGTQDDDHLIANPERKAARGRLHEAEAALATAERELATLLTSPELQPPRRTRPSRPPRTRSPQPGTPSPPPPPRSRKSPPSARERGHPRRAESHPGHARRSLQMVLRLLAAAAEHWLGNRLNDYLRDPDDTGPSPATCSTSAARSPARPRDHRDPRPPGRAPDRPRPRPAHRGDQRSPAPHARRHPAHHLPARDARI